MITGIRTGMGSVQQYFKLKTDISTFGVPADIGAHWLHGQKGNELAKFARKKHPDKSSKDNFVKFFAVIHSLIIF